MFLMFVSRPSRAGCGSRAGGDGHFPPDVPGRSPDISLPVLESLGHFPSLQRDTDIYYADKKCKDQKV